MAFHIALGLVASYCAYATVMPLLERPAVEPIVIPAVAPRAPTEITLARYAPIGERNLFESAADAPPESKVEEEALEESQLTYNLLGTIAGPANEVSVATLEDEQTQKHLHVRVGDALDESGAIKVARIERRRIVLDNKGNLEAITMDEEQRTAPGAPAAANPAAAPSAARGVPARTRTARSRADLLQRVRNLSNAARGGGAPAQAAPGADKANGMITNAAPVFGDLLQQVQLEPSFTEEGELAGMRIAAVVSGSPVEAAGIKVGDTIKSVNGIAVRSANDLPQVLPTLAGGSEACFELQSADGTTQTRCWRPN